MRTPCRSPAPCRGHAAEGTAGRRCSDLGGLGGRGVPSATTCRELTRSTTVLTLSLRSSVQSLTGGVWHPSSDYARVYYRAHRAGGHVLAHGERVDYSDNRGVRDADPTCRHHRSGEPQL